MKKIVLIDGNSLLFRAYYATAVRGVLMHSDDGTPTNAVFGFVNMFLSMMDQLKPDHILVAFDAGKKTFRHEQFEVYKAGRKETPQELIDQISVTKDFLKDYGVPFYQLAGYEADDIIGTVARMAEAQDFEVAIVTADKDLLQLITKQTTVYLTKKGVSDLEVNDEAKLYEKYQLTPKQIIDLKGLMGDPSDNIPGIYGIGEKTAIKLLLEYQTVENVIDHVEDLKGKLKERILENGHMGILSKEIATIDCFIPMTLTVDDLDYLGYDEEELRAFYQRYNLNTFIKRLDMNKPVEIKAEIHVNIVETMPLINKPTALMIGVLGDNYHRSSVLGYGIYNDEQAYFINYDDAMKDETFKSWLLSDQDKYGYNIKRQQLSSKWNQIPVDHFTFDLQLASYVLNPSLKDDFKIVCEYYDYDDVEYDEVIFGKGAKRAIPGVAVLAQHLIKQAKAIYLLKEEADHRLKQSQQYNLYQDIELPLASILAEMEYEGIYCDKTTLKDQGNALKMKIDAIEKSIFEDAGCEFNIGSPKQLGEVLFETLNLPVGKKNKTGYSTSVDVLEKLRDVHPIIQKIIDYRQYTKLFSTYIEGLVKEIFPDGKIHTIYNQALTQTGRLSSSDPNLQNIPVRLEEGRLIRKAFKPNLENSLLLSMDYSQIELRVLAEIADAKEMIEAFNQDYDIHSKTAMDLFEVPIDKITPLMRRQAKAINFGIIYGMSDFGMATQLDIPVKEAHIFIQKYFETFPSIKKYMEGIVEFCKQNGYVETLFNRKRYIPDINSKNFIAQSAAKRLAMNSPIQGSAADLLKIAMIKVDAEMKKRQLKSKMLLQVHDELVFEVLESELDEMIRLVKYHMENAYQMKVKIKVDYAFGPTWYDAK